MKPTSDTNDPGRDDALTRELLLLADLQQIEPPRELLDRVRAKLHENVVRSPSVAPTRTTAAWARSAWFAGAGAAAVLLIVLLFSLQPSRIAWSQVVEAVHAMPWIHMKAVGGEGKSQETWISFGRDIAATRCGNTVQYDDYRSGVRYEYDLQQRKLYRLSAPDYAAKVLQSEVEMFQAIFRGKAIRWEDYLPHMRIVKHTQRTVTEQSRRWIVYELEVQIGDPNDKDSSRTSSHAIYVDPERRLPERMTVTHGKEQMEATFDYPTEGPADIYALGVPRDARVEDRTPPPDLSRILKIVQQNRRGFGDYLAVASGANSNKPFLVRLIRCKGNKFRVDVGVGDTKHVASGADMGRWWQRHGKELLLAGTALCDGRRVYEHNPVHPEAGWKPLAAYIRQGDERAAAAAAGLRGAGRYLVDLLAYPRRLDPQDLASSSRWTAHLDPKGENGPAGSIRVELRLASQGGPADQRAYHKEDFWLHPKYGYAVVKYAVSACPAADKAPRREALELVYEYNDFRQTPRGVWYPTVSRFRNASHSQNKNKPGGIELHDQVTYFHLDFTAELPDELFSTAWKGNLLRGIDFAPRDDELTSKDLGKIRPPGGVPLGPAGPHAITVEEIETARQRLEATPEKDLEKWVVELERITNKKLDSWLERQGCRTYFVSHLSVAFDGLKWNAKTADKLFQRAQTMPPSEARAWREAFETLLNEEIKQAYAVPLVLIPVDAIYEGQKYREERAKEYLARIKRLTAEDVSLWKDKVDEFGGTRLDAAMNIILLDDYFDQGRFQRDKFKAAIGAEKN